MSKINHNRWSLRERKVLARNHAIDVAQRLKRIANKPKRYKQFDWSNKKLKNGMPVFIPPQAKKTKCKYCSVEISFGQTRLMKWIPIVNGEYHVCKEKNAFLVREQELEEGYRKAMDCE